MVSLQEARQAAQTLQDLQSKAALLPELERQQGISEAKVKIEALRQKLLTDNQKLYSQYQELYNEYKQQFLDLLEAMRKAHKTLFDLYQLKKAITDNRSKYAGKLLDFELKYNDGFDVYKDGYSVELQADNVSPFSLPSVVSVSVPNCPLAGEVERILNML